MLWGAMKKTRKNPAYWRYSAALASEEKAGAPFCNQFAR
jgi:hypothetical protein